MNDYRENIFFVPLLHVETRDWKNKKEQLKNISNQYNLYGKIDHEVDTDYFDKEKGYEKDIVYILNEELNVFVNHFNFEECTMKNAWFERARKDDFHAIHNHGPIGYSAVCFIDYDEKEHTSTTFISPFTDFIKSDVMKYQPDNITEGSIIFFPSSIQHYTLPNKSEKERLILSFNLGVS